MLPLQNLRQEQAYVFAGRDFSEAALRSLGIGVVISNVAKAYADDDAHSKM